MRWCNYWSLPRPENVNLLTRKVDQRSRRKLIRPTTILEPHSRKMGGAVVPLFAGQASGGVGYILVEITVYFRGISVRILLALLSSWNNTLADSSRLVRLHGQMDGRIMITFSITHSFTLRTHLLVNSLNCLQCYKRTVV